MADQKWKFSGRSSQPITLIASSLNSLAAGSAVQQGGVTSNESDLDLFVDLELQVTFASAPVAGELVKVYFVRRVDGTNLEDTVEGASPTRQPTVSSAPSASAT